ncbi:hypothetical protein D0T53_01975 [Dysgonomonas sp. 216]|uniref:hypothetical protein n=1 Tax=Dysgonomonas sp. 216 TaxID=2302934 RepID=UPI0013D849DC|nr:hypothetical protein [Dysgonomonas sp. 216]NDW17683.1 hypothetical protein [Dysgonomonas sp. 216]
MKTKVISLVAFIIISLSVKSQTLRTVGLNDWDTINESGFFSSARTTPNNPDSISDIFYGITIAHMSEKYGGQMAFRIMPHTQPKGIPNVWVRSRIHTGVGEWAKLIHSKGNHTMEGNLNFLNFTVRDNGYIGENITGKMGEGTRLYFQGNELSNNKVFFISKYNWSSNNSDLRINVRSGNDGKDRFVVGNNINNVWKSWLSVSNNGRVGIGVENPQNALDVKGTICADKVEIKAVTWADFVFAKDYKLPSLESVKQHIDEHKHLPDIPSEKEVIEKGIDVVEMQAKLLQKIEELTLYVIEQEQKNKDQKTQIEDLQNRLKNLESTK